MEIKTFVCDNCGLEMKTKNELKEYNKRSLIRKIDLCESCGSDRNIIYKLAIERKYYWDVFWASTDRMNIPNIIKYILFISNLIKQYFNICYYYNNILNNIIESMEYYLVLRSKTVSYYNLHSAIAHLKEMKKKSDELYKKAYEYYETKNVMIHFEKNDSWKKATEQHLAKCIKCLSDICTDIFLIMGDDEELNYRISSSLNSLYANFIDSCIYLNNHKLKSESSGWPVIEQLSIKDTEIIIKTLNYAIELSNTNI